CLAAVAAMLLGAARLAKPGPNPRVRGLGWWAGAWLALALSGSAWLGLVLGAGWLLLLWFTQLQHQREENSQEAPARSVLAAATAAALLLALGSVWAGALAWPDLAGMRANLR